MSRVTMVKSDENNKKPQTKGRFDEMEKIRRKTHMPTVKRLSTGPLHESKFLQKREHF
jgi:hypothetical protein